MNPFDIIPQRPFDEPLVCFEINYYWIKFLLGALYPFRYPENWLGTLEENRQARLDVLEIIDRLMTVESCGEGMADCCVQVQILNRINVTTGRVEISIDGGETWRPSPNDPIHNITEQPPPVPRGVSATKCDAASNGKQHIQDWVEKTATGFDTAVTFLEFAAVVIIAIADAILIFLTGGAFTAFQAEILALIGGLLVAVWNGGKELFVNYWTTDVYDRILCALYCNISADGSFTDSQYSAFIARLTFDLPGSLAKSLFMGFLQSIGRQGLNNLCSYGNSADADCSSCSCGCDWSDWVVTTGDIISQSVSSVVLHSQYSAPYWYAGIRNPNPVACCCDVDFTVEGVEPNVVGYVPCNQANDDESNELYAYTGQAANRFDFRGDAEFTLTIVSTGECP